MASAIEVEVNQCTGAVRSLLSLQRLPIGGRTGIISFYGRLQFPKRWSESELVVTLPPSAGAVEPTPSLPLPPPPPSFYAMSKFTCPSSRRCAAYVAVFLWWPRLVCGPPAGGAVVSPIQARAVFSCA